MRVPVYHLVIAVVFLALAGGAPALARDAALRGLVPCNALD